MLNRTDFSLKHFNQKKVNFQLQVISFVQLTITYTIVLQYCKYFIIQPEMLGISINS